MSRKLYQTPPDLPESVVCRTLLIPNSKEWLGIFNSAVLTLLNTYNWEQVNDTDLSIDDTIALIVPMINAFWDTLDCDSPDRCLLPTGGRILRIGLHGHLEQLAGGEWVTPDGDYTVPPVPAREEATEVERLCAAAANAEYVLRTLYEEVTDLVGAEASQAEVIAAVFTFLVETIGVWLGLAFGSLAPLVIAAFVVFYEIAVFITADLWDSEFSDILKCLLLACASDDGDVVTFDWECVNEQLATTVDLLDPDAINQLRLFGQITFILSVIGVDGLNAAGATTAVTSPDCVCNDHCFRLDFRFTNGVSYGYHNSGGTYDFGAGYTGINGGSVSRSDVFGYWDFGVDVYVTEVRMVYLKTGGSGANNVNKLNGLHPTATAYNTTTYAFDNSNPTSGSEQVKTLTVNHALRGIGVDINTGTFVGTSRVIAFEVYYTGDINPDWTDNCDDF